MIIRRATDQLDDHMNESYINFKKAGDGWEGEWSVNRYYCEKIIGNLVLLSNVVAS